MKKNELKANLILNKRMKIELSHISRLERDQYLELI